jgi:hypothetical protein
MTGNMIEAAWCAWCGRAFIPRATGGKRQVFCRPACRRGFDAAGRRWVAEAIATGTLSLDALRNGAAATRALVAAAISPVPIPAPEAPAAVALAGGADETAELLDDLLIALLELPGHTWPDLVAALPNELFDPDRPIPGNSVVMTGKMLPRGRFPRGALTRSR